MAGRANTMNVPVLWRRVVFKVWDVARNLQGMPVRAAASDRRDKGLTQIVLADFPATIPLPAGSTRSTPTDHKNSVGSAKGGGDGDCSAP